MSASRLMPTRDRVAGGRRADRRDLGDRDGALIGGVALVLEAGNAYGHQRLGSERHRRGRRSGAGCSAQHLGGDICMTDTHVAAAVDSFATTNGLVTSVTA